MSFLAQHPKSGEAVSTNDIGDSINYRQELECPWCGGTVKYRKPARDDNNQVVRKGHFWHTDNIGGGSEGGGCSAGGESELHENTKELVGALLEEKYETEGYEVERPVGDRYADVALPYDGPGRMRGVIAEVQINNDSKNYLEVTKKYLRHGYAVHWIFDTSNGYDEMFDAKNELEGYADNCYLGQRDAVDVDGLIDLGSRIWLDNFEWIVTDPSDLKPITWDEDAEYSGVYRCRSRNGRNRTVYSLSKSNYDTWEDIHLMYYDDGGGGEFYEHFKRELRTGEMELVNPPKFS